MTTSWAPPYEIDGPNLTVTSAWTVNGVLDAWYRGPVPTALTPFGAWLMDQANYTPPTPATPTTRPTKGRMFPRGTR